MIRCRVCYRTEKWAEGSREVVVEGGGRKPAGHPSLVAWRTVRDALSGETGPVVGACAACGQPMVAEGQEAAWVDWPLETPDGTLMIRDGVLPAGSDIATLDARMEEAWAERLRLADIKPGQAMFTGGLMTLLMVPVAVWALAVCVVTGFLYMVLMDPSATIPGIGQGVTLPGP